MKKLMCIAFMAMVLPVVAWAQLSIGGKVQDMRNQQVLSGATVLLSNGQSAQTNSEGIFSFRNLPAGNYKLKVSFVGYETFSQNLSASADLKIEVNLKVAALFGDEVVVKSTRASEQTATTYRNLSKAEIQKNNVGQDLPFVLNQTPGVVVSSDAGAGIGYTGIRIRGSDATRINVTLNGIPFNDPESQGTFFVNLPDFVSSADNIQVQRGVGTSTNGAGAFGASINLQTTTRHDTAYAELNTTFGSFNTSKNTINFGSGLINNQFTFDGRLSKISSDGYIDRASSRLKSYFLTGAWYGKNTLIRANVFSGTEKTYQAWNGVPEELLTTNRTFNGFTYEDQTDNYTQDHYQMLYAHRFSSKLSINGALHYTYGRGYYEEYKEDQDFVKYGFSPIVLGATTINQTDLIRRRWLDNDFYGMTYNLTYQPKDGLELTLGGAYNEYNGDHFGEVIWAKYASQSKIRERYYDNNGFKTDFNSYAKLSYQRGLWSYYADLQYRRVSHEFVGFDTNLQNLQQAVLFNFFNPKAGVTYQLNDYDQLYASIAVANKEPNRDDLTNSSPSSRPQSERLIDWELGYRVKRNRFDWTANAYYMQYQNQLILTGEINDVGAYTRQNVPDSYRLGLEIDGKWQINTRWSWTANLAISRNKIKNYTNFIDNFDNNTQVATTYRNTDIAFSPAVVAGSELGFKPLERAEIALLCKYVGRQFLDNTANTKAQLDAFLVNDLRLSYQLKTKAIKNIGMSLLINNLFNEYYETNGFTFSAISGGELSRSNAFFPQATRNFLFSLNMKF
jgi:iron complex outermembrane receptor protein